MPSKLSLAPLAMVLLLSCSLTNSSVSSTPPPPCPIAGGDYLLTSTSGGTYRLATIAPFALPPGATIVEEVAHANPPDCVHEVVIPPNGFSMPVFCIPALSFTVAMIQSGCGVGRLDSNGSSDFNVWETGDTTDTSGVCPSVPAVCVDGNDSAERMEMVVGDHTPDVCLGSGTANELLSIPIDTVIWLAAGGVCPDPDGKVDPSDTLVVRLSQVLDLTTDQSFSEWRDFDKDGCCINGIGPNTTANPCTAFTSGPLGSQGKCLDTTGGTVTLAGTGTTASATGPLFDVTFSFMQPYLVTGPTPGGGSTCTTAPVMTFGGNATRCVP